MILADAWKEYNKNTQILSELARKLAFGSAVICWFFRSKEITFPNFISFALGFIVLFFLFDLFQYFSAVLKIRKWLQFEEVKVIKEKGKLSGDEEVLKPTGLVKPIFFFFLFVGGSIDGNDRWIFFRISKWPLINFPCCILL